MNISKNVVFCVLVMSHAVRGFSLPTLPEKLSMPSNKTVGMVAATGTALATASYILCKKHLRKKIVRMLKRNPKKSIAIPFVLAAIAGAYYYGYFDYAQKKLIELMYGAKQEVKGNDLATSIDGDTTRVVQHENDFDI